jgi:hypothetical protein
MTDLSQPWYIIPTETDCATQVPPVVDQPNPESMTALTTTFTEGERDEVYYWDTVQFLVSSLAAELNPDSFFTLGWRVHLQSAPISVCRRICLLHQEA